MCGNDPVFKQQEKQDSDSVRDTPGCDPHLSVVVILLTVHTEQALGTLTTYNTTLCIGAPEQRPYHLEMVSGERCMLGK